MLLYRQRATVEEEPLKRLMAAGLAEPIAALLVLRGIRTAEEAEAFLQPSLKHLHSPFLMPDMARIVERLRKAKEKQERLVVYGDYDADGVTATALLVDFLSANGYQTDYYIPDRHEEGYGLNEKAVRELAKTHPLMVTVDCGITSLAEVRLSKSLGMDVIITDHHQPLDELPDAPTINSHIGGYPFPHLSGVGVAFKLVQALGGMEAAYPYLDLAAIGTVSDIVSLTGENRVIVYYGLQSINAQPRVGIQALMDASGLAGKPLTSMSVGFTLGPRINAGGRIGHSARSVEMLITKDKALAAEIAQTLDQHNQIRQAQELGIMTTALAQIAADPDFATDRALIVTGEDWNPGVVGIVASRLLDRYHKPTFVMARQGDCYVASARSIKGVHLFNTLKSMEALFERYGGHEMAAGLTIKAERLDDFRRRVNERFAQMDDRLWIPTAVYDLKARLPDFTIEYVKALQCLEPFGQGNQSPVYLVEEAQVVTAGTMGQGGNHLRLNLRQDETSMDAAAFKMGARLSEASGAVDMIVSPDINVWQGRTSVRLMVRQFSTSPTGFTGYARAQEEEDFLHILPLLLREPEPGFRRHLPCTEDVILSLIRGSLMGTLLIYQSAQTAAEWVEKLQAASILERVELAMGRRKSDAPPFNLLAAYPRVMGESLVKYRNIVFLDGVMDKALVDETLSASPGAVVYAPRSAARVFDLLARFSPSVETVRALYRALRAAERQLPSVKDIFSLQALLSARLKLALPSLHLSLLELCDMGLIQYQPKPFLISFTPGVQGKRDIAQTVTRIRLAALQKRGEEKKSI